MWGVGVKVDRAFRCQAANCGPRAGRPGLVSGSLYVPENPGLWSSGVGAPRVTKQLAGEHLLPEACSPCRHTALEVTDLLACGAAMADPECKWGPDPHI